MERVAEAIARAYANSPFLAGLVDRNQGKRNSDSASPSVESAA